MARPRKTLPRGGVEIIRRLASDGCSDTQIAQQLRMDRRTLARIRQENPKAQAAYEEGRAAEETELVGLLMEKARRGDKVSAMFLLKSRHNYRDMGPIEGQEDEHRSVSIHLNAPMTEAQYHALFRKPIEHEGKANGGGA